MIRGKIQAAAYLALRRGRDRRAVSPGFAVGVRLGAGIGVAGIGVNEEDCKQIIAILERDRLIDYVNASIGDYFRMDVRLGTYLEAAEVRAENPDVLIVATGSMPRMDGIQVAAPCHAPSGVNLPHVLSSRDLIEGAELSGASTAL